MVTIPEQWPNQGNYVTCKCLKKLSLLNIQLKSKPYSYSGKKMKNIKQYILILHSCSNMMTTISLDMVLSGPIYE